MIWNLFFVSDLAKQLPLEVNPHTMDSAHTKANLLLQAHFSQIQLPSSDYNTDTKSVLDQAIRICQVKQGCFCYAHYVPYLCLFYLNGMYYGRHLQLKLSAL